MVKAKRESISTETTLDGLLSDALSELEELGQEMREAFDNTPEGLQGSSVGQAREEAADTLEGLESPDIPSEYQDHKITYTHFPLKAKAPRRERRDAATSKIDTVINELTSIKDDLEEEKESEANSEKIQELESAIGDIERVKDDADAVEFPGMRG